MTWTHRDTAVLRVYSEERPFEPLIAVRLVHDAFETIDKACRRFIEAIADRTLIDVVSKDEEARRSLPDGFGDPGIVLYPIPPPLPPDLVSDMFDA